MVQCGIWDWCTVGFVRLVYWLCCGETQLYHMPSIVILTEVWLSVSLYIVLPCLDIIIPPASTKLKGGYTGITLSVCQFAADDILLYEFCYYIQWIYFTIWKKEKKKLSPLQYHFKSLHIISRHYKKSLLRSQIYHGYEELSTDKNYPIWRRQERRSKYTVQLASWQLRSNSPKTSVRLSFFTVLIYFWGNVAYTN